MVTGIVSRDGKVKYGECCVGDSGVCCHTPGMVSWFRCESRVGMRGIVIGLYVGGGGSFKAVVGNLCLVDGHLLVMSISGVSFRWYIVFFRALGFQQMNVPGSMPPVTILTFFGAFVSNAV